MLNLITDIQLKSSAKSFGKGIKQQFIPWSNIQNIALVLNHNQQVNKSAIDKFIDKSQKHFEVFYIEASSKAATYADWQCFTKNDLNLIKLPKKTLLQFLHKKQFDLVMNASEQNDKIAQSIAVALNANFKCGAFENFSQTNLVIKRQEPFNLIAYLEETVKYLKMIKN